jgi:hypothetical protein
MYVKQPSIASEDRSLPLFTEVPTAYFALTELLGDLVLCSSHTVNKDAPPVPERFGLPTPHPRACFPV